jgi:hypothetical protein
MQPPLLLQMASVPKSCVVVKPEPSALQVWTVLPKQRTLEGAQTRQRPAAQLKAQLVLKMRSPSSEQVRSLVPLQPSDVAGRQARQRPSGQPRSRHLIDQAVQPLTEQTPPSPEGFRHPERKSSNAPSLAVPQRSDFFQPVL